MKAQFLFSLEYLQDSNEAARNEIRIINFNYYSRSNIGLSIIFN